MSNEITPNGYTLLVDMVRDINSKVDKFTQVLMDFKSELDILCEWRKQHEKQLVMDHEAYEKQAKRLASLEEWKANFRLFYAIPSVLAWVVGISIGIIEILKFVR